MKILEIEKTRKACSSSQDNEDNEKLKSNGIASPPAKRRANRSCDKTSEQMKDLPPGTLSACSCSSYWRLSTVDASNNERGGGAILQGEEKSEKKKKKKIADKSTNVG